MKLLPIILGFIFTYGVSAQELRYSDEEVIDSYHYLLARLLVIKQEREDFKQNGYRWNKLIHNKNSKKELAVSSAWIGLDKKSCTTLEIPDLNNRYFSIQVFNGWGEVIHKVDNKKYSERYSYCLPGTKLESKISSTRVSVSYPKMFLKILIERGDAKGLKEIQHSLKLSSTGKPKMKPVHSIGKFSRKKLPGILAFQNAKSILRLEPDENPDMSSIRETLHKMIDIARDPSEQKPIDLIIQKWAVPSFFKQMKMAHDEVSWHQEGRYATFPPYLERSVNNYQNLWENHDEEIHYSTKKDSEGDKLSSDEIYTMTIDAKSLQRARVWSLRVSNSSASVDHTMSLGHNLDGSLTLYFSSYKPLGIRAANWISLRNKKEIELNLKMFGVESDLTQSENFPPELMKARHRISNNKTLKI